MIFFSNFNDFLFGFIPNILSQYHKGSAEPYILPQHQKGQPYVCVYPMPTEYTYHICS